MRRSIMFSAATAALALAASSVSAQIYSFETLYDNTDTINPAGTRPDDFRENAAGGTVTQSTIGATNGTHSMEVTQVGGATFTGALTTLIPELINDPATQALGFDITIPATGNFTGAFARMGVSEFGNNTSQMIQGQPVQTDPASSEVNIDLAPGTYHLTIPLIAIDNPLTGDPLVPFSNCFGSDPNTQLTPTSFEFYFNKSSGASALNVYMDNVIAIGPTTNGTWAHATGGSWSTLGNWTGGIPQVALDTATFSSAITADSNITLDGNRSVKTLTFNNSSHHYTISAGTGGTLTFDAAGSNTSNIIDSAGTHTISAPIFLTTNTVATVTNAGDTLNLNGNIGGIGSLTVMGGGTVGVSGTNSYVGGTTISSGTLLVGSATALPTANAVVNIAAGAKMQFATGIGGVSLQLPNITAGGTLDIGNNHLIINYTGADPLATVMADLQTGFNGGTWTGTGITSSNAAANSGSYGIGYADAADPGNPAGLASGTIELKYTLLGDANLDGAVNGSDFAILASDFNKADQAGHSGWDEGDFNYDGSVNGSDFALLAANFNKGASQSAVDSAALDSFASSNGLLTSVPEPASVGLLILGGLGVLGRRKRRVQS